MDSGRIGFIAVIGICLATAAAAQDKHEFSGMLLTNNMGELCTMCEANMACTSADGAVTTYHFHKRGFWGQMSTVLDYFPPTREWGLRHTRPATVRMGENETTAEAAFDLRKKRIEISGGPNPATWVDRTTGEWHGADDAVIGSCTADKI